jgi:hypothetical protein
MPVIPESTKASLAQRLRDRSRQGWPQLAGVDVRYHGRDRRRPRRLAPTPRPRR